jgi:hypothetical protein
LISQILHAGVAPEQWMVTIVGYRISILRGIHRRIKTGVSRLLV